MIIRARMKPRRRLILQYSEPSHVPVLSSSRIARFGRVCLAVGSGISLLLCTAALMLWFESLSGQRTVIHHLDGTTLVSLAADRGGLMFYRGCDIAPDGHFFSDSAGRQLDVEFNRAGPRWNDLGLARRDSSISSELAGDYFGQSTAVFVPAWLICGLTLLLPMVQVVRYRRQMGR
jgi:hypothetical protein